MRTVTLRDEVNGDDRRYLGARIDEAGDLVLEGQDLGPSTAPVSPDGEYEWWVTIAAKDIAQLLDLLDAAPSSDVLEILEENWSGARTHELERPIREGALPHRVSAYP